MCFSPDEFRRGEQCAGYLVNLNSLARFFRRFAEPERGFRFVPPPPTRSAASGRQFSGGWRRNVMDTRGPAQAETQCFATLPELPPSNNSDRRGSVTDRPTMGCQAQARVERNDRPTRMGSSPSSDSVRMGRA